MTVGGIVLIIALGYSPSGASGTSMEVSKHIQPSLEICQTAAKELNEMRTGRWDLFALCVEQGEE